VAELGKVEILISPQNRSCVDEIVSAEAGKLKFAKRKLRVQRCKGKGTSGPSQHIRGTQGSKPQELTQKGTTPKQGVRSSAANPVWKRAKGDPKLGERLKGLSKEERKEAKKSDALRQERRLEKKKAKVALEKAMSGKEKERVRARKATGLKKHGKHKRGA
jgi:nucleolar protein 12